MIYNKSTGGIPHNQLGCTCTEGFQDLCANHNPETEDCIIALKNYKNQTKMTNNKNLIVKKISRTAMVELINSTKGRFFTSIHIGKDNKPHVVNGVRPNDQRGVLGYIRVHGPKDKIRLINPQTVTDLKFGGVHYKVK